MKVICVDDEPLAVEYTFLCDAYLFYSGDSNAINAYRGEYMSSYSWANMTEAILYWKTTNR